MNEEFKAQLEHLIDHPEHLRLTADEKEALTKRMKALIGVNSHRLKTFGPLHH